MELKTSIQLGKRNREIGHQSVVVSGGEISLGGKRSSISTVILSLIICLLVGGIIGYVYFQSAFVEVKNLAKLSEKDAAIAALEEEKRELESQIQSLNDKVEILSMTVNTKVAAEAELTEQLESAALPSELPVSGSVSLEEATETVTVNLAEVDPEALVDMANADGQTAENEANADGVDVQAQTMEVERPICVLSAQVGSMVVAAGSGTIISVMDDSEYGHCVMIDHGNGYVTIYRNSGDVMVKEGDEIAAGATIYYINPENVKLGYQMTFEGEYINPMDMLTISG